MLQEGLKGSESITHGCVVREVQGAQCPMFAACVLEVPKESNGRRDGGMQMRKVAAVNNEAQSSPSLVGLVHDYMTASVHFANWLAG